MDLEVSVEFLGSSTFVSCQELASFTDSYIEMQVNPSVILFQLFIIYFGASSIFLAGKSIKIRSNNQSRLWRIIKLRLGHEVIVMETTGLNLVPISTGEKTSRMEIFWPYNNFVWVLAYLKAKKMVLSDRIL